MAQQTIRTVYEDGKLRPLDAVDFAEGQEIQLMVISSQKKGAQRHLDEIRQALGDLVVETPERSSLEFDEEALQQEIDSSIKGDVQASQIIIDERRAGP